MKQNCFMRIDRDILCGLPAARMHDETALWLTRRLARPDRALPGRDVAADS